MMVLVGLELPEDQQRLVDRVDLRPQADQVDQEDRGHPPAHNTDKNQFYPILIAVFTL